MDLQEYDFMVFHRPGSANGNADALSRLPLQEPLFHPGEPTNKGSSTACSTAITPGASLQQSQLADARLSKIIELKSNKFPSLSGQRTLFLEFSGIVGTVCTLSMAYWSRLL